MQVPWPAAQLSELVLSDKAGLSPAIEGGGSVRKQSSQFSSLACDTDKAGLSPAVEGEGSVLKQSSQFSSLACDTDFQAGCWEFSLGAPV